MVVNSVNLGKFVKLIKLGGYDLRMYFSRGLCLLVEDVLFKLYIEIMNET